MAAASIVTVPSSIRALPIIHGDAWGFNVVVDVERDWAEPFTVRYRGRDLMHMTDRYRAIVFCDRMAEPDHG